MSERVLAEIEPLVEAEPAGSLNLKGFPRPVPAFRLLQVKGDAAGGGITGSPAGGA